MQEKLENIVLVVSLGVVTLQIVCLTNDSYC